MILYSTNKEAKNANLKKAVLQGLAEDGGLYMPTEIPKLTSAFFKNIENLSFQEIAFEVSKTLIQEEVPDQDLKIIIEDAVNFDAPLVEISENLYSLELFHGPTLAFKDFGARFMSRLMGYFLKDSHQKTTILVATSGDTGSAVAQGFLNIPNIEVVLLYPSGKVSHLQEQQLTTMGANIKALEVDGSFDNCQAMVKKAFVSPSLSHLNLSSANSINIARVIPQSFYYFNAYAQLLKKGISKKPIFSIPSGNFGNLTAGLIANKMGLPVNKFIAATNANDTFTRYMETGVFSPKPSVKTIANAMDVGNPSNFARLLELFKDEKEMKKIIWSERFTDQETQDCMEKVVKETGYTLDPHGAVAYLGLEKYRKKHPENKDNPEVFLETAHPAKFLDVLPKSINQEIPERLAKYAKREKQSIKIHNEFSELEEILLKN